VSVLDRFPVLFIPYKAYGEGVCCSCLIPNGVYPVNTLRSGFR